MTDQPYTKAEVEAAARAIVVFSKRSSDEWRDAVVHAALTAAYGCPDGTVERLTTERDEAVDAYGLWRENWNAELHDQIKAAEATAQRYREALEGVTEYLEVNHWCGSCEEWQERGKGEGCPLGQRITAARQALEQP